MKIRAASACLFDVRRDPPLSGTVQTFSKWEVVLVDIETDEGIVGTGYAYTIGTGGYSVLELLNKDLLGRLIGQDARQVESIWRQLFVATRGTVVGPITSLALAAIDIALWDLRGKALGQPIWLLAGGAQARVPVYDTEGRWMGLSNEQLVEHVKESQASGWAALKLKVGKLEPQADLERVSAVRSAVGDNMTLMVEASQSMTYAEAKRLARLLERVDPFWFEEPLPADDVAGHVRLSHFTSIPIAVGESLYSLGQFREYLVAGAAGIIQPDVGRIGGITPWLKVAHLADAFNVKLAPHFLMELHVSLAAAVPNAIYLEYFNQLKTITHSLPRVEDGFAIPPSEPGTGIQWDREAIAHLRLA